MMKGNLFATVLFLSLVLPLNYVYAQADQAEAELQGFWSPSIEGNHDDHAECLPIAHKTAVLAQVAANVKALEAAGWKQENNADAFVSFNWPLRPRNGFTDPSYYSIGNYVDENGGSGLLDYYCGARTYNGHRGTDIGIWPFSWSKMANNDVEVVAAASGTIVFRQDGNFDQNCSWNNQTGNGIIIQHADGTRTWYWHMKRNSLTTKMVGAFVSAGEYLGVVGSSGISTGPHLHFEVDQIEGQSLIDPWGGSCNFLGGQSWWSAQKPYYDPKILKIMTHSAAPAMSQCPGGESVNASNTFQPGQLAIFAGYFRDYLAQTNATYVVKRPNGTTWNTWTVSNVTNYLNLAYWWWGAYLPADAPTGTWSFQVTYQGQTQIHNFTVGSASCNTPAGLSTTNITQTSARANWSAVSGALNYTVQYRLANGTWINVAGSPFTSTTANISGLAANTNYQWRVRSNCSGGSSSAYSGSVAFTTTSGSSCNAPTGLYAGSVTQNTATLYWNGVSGALNYNVQFLSNGAWTNLSGGPFTGTSVGIYGLYANSVYSWRVIANCSSGQSAPSATSSFSSESAPNCTGGYQYPNNVLSPAANWKYLTLVWGGEYSLVSVVAGQTYTFSYCASDGGMITFDGEISIKTTSDQLIAYNDDVCGTSPKLIWRAGFTGQVRVLLTKYQCASQPSNSTLAYKIGSSSMEEYQGEIWPVPVFQEEKITQLVTTERQEESRDAELNSTVEPAVFPNPAHDFVILKWSDLPATQPVSIKIFSALGQLVYDQETILGAGDTQFQISLSGFANGIYMLDVSGTEGKRFSRFIQVQQ